MYKNELTVHSLYRKLSEIDWIDSSKNILSYFQGEAITLSLLRPCRSNWSERLQQLQRTAEQSGEDTVTSKRVISWNQRSCFGSSDVNLAVRYDPDNFACHLVLKATTRNQQDPFKIYSYKSCKIWCTKSQKVFLKITLNYSVAQMASYLLSPCFLGKFRAQLHFQRWDTVAGENWWVPIV